jgi:hypothetical protein
VATIVIAVSVVALSLRSGPGIRSTEPLGNLEFYSDDDGASFFVDDVKELTPFEHEGKSAVRAYVYRCAGEAPFVGYLQRQTDHGRQQKGVTNNTGSRPTVADPAIFEVKKPGDRHPWVPADPRHFAQVLDVMNVPCPANGRESAILIHPAQR